LAEALALGQTVDRELRGDLRERLGPIRSLATVPDDVFLEQPDWLELVASLDYLLTVRRHDFEKAEDFLKRHKSQVAPFAKRAHDALIAHGLS
jgi:hypothetical protein